MIIDYALELSDHSRSSLTCARRRLALDTVKCQRRLADYPERFCSQVRYRMDLPAEMLVNASRCNCRSALVNLRSRHRFGLAPTTPCVSPRRKIDGLINTVGGLRTLTTASHISTMHDDTDPAAQAFVMRLVRSFGFDVVYRDDMQGPYGADRDTGKILLPNGLPWRVKHSRLDRAFLYLLGGPGWAHEFAPPAPPGTNFPGNVLPLIRRVW